MYEPMKTDDFNRLLRMAVDRHGIDPKDTYVEFTWWDNVFLPLIDIDCDRKNSGCILVFGDSRCNLFYGKGRDGIVYPTGFWINKDAAYADQVVHRPNRLSRLIDSKFIAEFDTVDFLLCGNPVNSRVKINPFKTRVYRNFGGETILAFYAEDRDSGEWRPFSAMSSEYIRAFDDRPKMCSEGYGADGDGSPDPPRGAV